VKCTVGMRGSRSDTEHDCGTLGEVCCWNEGF
jgi:hypothetical protein